MVKEYTALSVRTPPPLQGRGTHLQSSFIHYVEEDRTAINTTGTHVMQCKV